MCPSPHELEGVLRKARPEPPPDFVRSLEHALLPHPERRTRRERWAPRWRVAAAACASAAALVAIGIVLGVAGALPFSAGAGDDAEAGPVCRTVIVERRARVGYVVRDKHGGFRLRYRREMVQRPVKRCR